MSVCKECHGDIGGCTCEEQKKIIQLQAELEQVKADMELKGYSLTYKQQAAEIERLMDGLLKVMELLSTIRKVACGEEQIDSDGSYSDTDALQWIYERINDLEKALKGKNDGN